MALIEISRPHALRSAEARALVESVVGAMQESYSLDYRWEGERLHFERPGVTGQIEIAESDVRVRVRLGLLLRPLQHHLEQQIHSYLDDLLK